MSDLHGQCMMFIAAQLKTFFIDVGVVEDSLTIFLGKNRHNRSIDLVHRDELAFKGGDQSFLEDGEAGKLDVHSRLQGESRRFGRVFCHVVVLFQLSDRFIVGDDESIETPLLFKKVDDKLDVGGARNSVDVMIGGHHTPDGGVFQDLLEGKAIGIEQFIHSRVQGSMVSSAFTAAVADEVLQRGERLTVLPLETVDVGDRHFADEIGVFAERLLQTPPTGIPGDIENRRQALVNAH
ncbi:MAG: hypothetical protein BWY50_01009 [Spirochaetes bacterium ADurb.Bin315]|nr:MAG: hypothetical protein BWY50_01009 [Spirochaetes bacterium ADurb.Bin315]